MKNGLENRRCFVYPQIGCLNFRRNCTTTNIQFETLDSFWEVFEKWVGKQTLFCLPSDWLSEFSKLFDRRRAGIRVVWLSLMPARFWHPSPPPPSWRPTQKPNNQKAKPSKHQPKKQKPSQTAESQGPEHQKPSREAKLITKPKQAGAKPQSQEAKLKKRQAKPKSLGVAEARGALRHLDFITPYSSFELLKRKKTNPFWGNNLFEK